MALAAEDAEQLESLGDRVSLQPCQADQSGDRGSNRRSPGEKGLGLGKEGAAATSPETVVTLQGAPQLPSLTGLGYCRRAWHQPQKPSAPPSSPARAGRFHKLPGLPDERRFLRVIKPSPLGTMGPYPAVSFT